MAKATSTYSEMPSLVPDTSVNLLILLDPPSPTSLQWVLEQVPRPHFEPVSPTETNMWGLISEAFFLHL